MNRVMGRLLGALAVGGWGRNGIKSDAHKGQASKRIKKNRRRNRIAKAGRKRNRK